MQGVLSSLHRLSIESFVRRFLCIRWIVFNKTCSSNRSAGKSDGSYSGLSKSSLYQGRNWKIYFCNTLFHESFLTQDQSAEKWLLSQRDFCELISVTEMEAYRNEHTHLNLVEDVLFRTDSGQYLSSHFLMDTEILFCGNFMMLLKCLS